MMVGEREGEGKGTYFMYLLRLHRVSAPAGAAAGVTYKGC